MTDVIIRDSRSKSFLRVFLVLFVVALGSVFVHLFYVVFRGESPLALIWPCLVSVGALLLDKFTYISKVIVDEFGIHVGPLFDRPWKDIDSIVKPNSVDTVVRVRMAGSGRVRRIGFPPEDAAKIAKIGGRKFIKISSFSWWK